MEWLIGSSLRFGRLVVAAALGLLVLGAVQLRGATVDTYPEFMPPTVQVQTEALGLSAAEVEQLVTLGLEQDLLNGVPWLDHVHSRSEPGLSVIDLVFEPGTDLYAARQMVQERLTQAHALPNVGSPPIMIEPLSSTGRVAMVGLSSTSVPLIDMSLLARWKIKPKLMGIPGVANVAIYGQRDRQLQVQVDPQRLQAAAVSLTQVIETAGNALWVSPLTFVEASTPGTGGFVEGANQRLAVQHVLPITTAQNLAQVPVEGAPAGTLRLGDVAQVVEDHQPLIGDAVGTGTPSLFLVVQRFPDANAREVSQAVDKAMADLAPGMAGITVDTSVYRPASFLDSALHDVGLAAVGALVLLLGVLLLVMSGWRAAVVAIVAVPVSLVTALIVMDLQGRTLTTMTLAGLAVALVLVVDDAVGDVTAVRRRLREQAEDGQPVRTSDLVVAVVGRIRRAMTFALVVILVCTLPFLVLGPVTTAFTRDLVGGFAITVAASMVVALTLTPTLAVLLLRNESRRTPWFDRVVAGTLGRRLGGLALRPAAGWAVLGLLAVSALAAVPQLGSRAFLPQLADRDLLVDVSTAPGTSLPEMTRVTDRMAAELRTVPGVADVGAHVGRAVTSDTFGDVNSGEIWIGLTDSADVAAARARIGRVLAGYAGVRSSLQTYGSARVAAALAGTDDDLVVRLFGQDDARMRATAEQIRTTIAAVPGIGSARIRQEPVQPTARVEVDLAAAQKYGLRPGDVRREATTLVSGLTVGNLYEQSKVFDVVVLGTPAARADLTGLGDVLIGTPSGGHVRLADVARITVAPEPVAVVHDQVQRSLDVVASVRGRGASAVADDVRAAVAGVAMPAQTHLQVLGAAEVRQSDLRRTLWWALGAVVVALLVLQAAVGGWWRAALMTLVIPLGAVGGVLTAPLAGGVATTGAIAGLFAVMALTTRAAVLVVRRTAELEQVGDLRAGRLAAAAAARDRVVPVLGSALAVAAVQLPVILLGDRAGLELLRPMAVTVLGGLVTSVVVTLVVLPAVCGTSRTPSREPIAAAPDQAPRPASV